MFRIAGRHWLALALLAGMLGAARDLAAEIEGIQLQVDGLSCPLCALGLDKRLKERAGLEQIQIHMKQGVAEASLPPGQGLDVGKLRMAIQEAGFTLRAISLTVVGTIIQDGGYLAIESRRDGTKFLLFDAEHRETGDGPVLNKTRQDQLEQAHRTAKLMRIKGVVHEHAGLSPALMVEVIEELSE